MNRMAILLGTIFVLGLMFLGVAFFKNVDLGLLNIPGLLAILSTTLLLSMAVYGELGFKTLFLANSPEDFARAAHPMRFSGRTVFWFGLLLTLGGLFVQGKEVFDFIHNESFKEGVKEKGLWWQVREAYSLPILKAFIPLIHGFILKILLFDPCYYFAVFHARGTVLRIPGKILDSQDSSLEMNPIFPESNETEQMQSHQIIAGELGHDTREMTEAIKKETGSASLDPKSVPKDDDTDSDDIMLPKK